MENYMLTRRKFLLVASFAGLPLAAYGQFLVTPPAPAVIPKPTDTPKPTDVSKPINTPSPAPTATVKPTEVPKPVDVPKLTAMLRATTIATKGTMAKPVIHTIYTTDNPWSAATANVHVAKQLIESKLDYRVEVVGAEEAQLQLLQEAYNKKQLFLFYFWTPHSVHYSHRFTSVKLTKFTE